MYSLAVLTPHAVLSLSPRTECRLGSLKAGTQSLNILALMTSSLCFLSKTLYGLFGLHNKVEIFQLL